MSYGKRMTGTVEKMHHLGDFAHIKGDDGIKYFAWPGHWKGPLRKGDRVEFDVRPLPEGRRFPHAVNIVVTSPEPKEAA